jgi:hypothetical protein
LGGSGQVADTELGLPDSDDEDEVEKGLYELDEHGGYTKVQQLDGMDASPILDTLVRFLLSCGTSVFFCSCRAVATGGIDIA